MLTDYEAKCKDSAPLKTAGRIKDILEGLGILTEERWTSQADGFYSVDINIFGTAITASGKGTTPVYAIASGYAELVERMQNMYFSSMPLDYGNEVLKHGGFYFAPDEKEQSIDEILECKDSWIRAFTLNADTKAEKTRILKEWLFEDKASGFISIPFTDISDGSMHYLPKVMLLCLYGSNGMCAGNTPEEALVHGMCEIVESHVRDAVLTGKIIPPAIPRGFLEKYPKIWQKLGAIEQQGSFRVILKDCSMGEGWPAVAVILSDINRHRCAVGFGAHPVFELAVERCLTDLMQGRDLKNTDWLTDFSYYGKGKPAENSDKAVIASIPSSLFTGNSSYTFSGLSSTDVFVNKTLLLLMCDLFKNKGYDVLIRDVSFLGFPSYQVIIPLFGEIKNLTADTVRTFSEALKAERTARNLKHCTDKELQQLVDYAVLSSGKDFTSEDSIVKLLGIPFKSDFHWYGYERDMFIALAYYRLGESRKAYDTMERYIKRIDKGIKDAGVTYLKSVRDYLGMRADGINNEERIKRLLGVFYQENVVLKVTSELRKQEDVFQSFEGLRCFNCSSCEWLQFCMYPKTERIRVRLKELYTSNKIDQLKIMDAFL